MDFRRALGPATWNLVLDEGRLRVDLEGEFTAILALAADNKKPGSLSAAGWQSKSSWLRGQDLNL
jgi:hypothetical protein